MSSDDATWLLSNSFLILTMQTGFGMLEAGSVSGKNVANIMVKNVVDVSLGGVVYWAVGYGLSFGRPGNPFCGAGDFFATAPDMCSEGSFYSFYVFQFSFSTAATTIVSGAVAERMKLSAYMAFASFNILIYCFPASWAWNKPGFLKALGFVDLAGGCVVHLTGGASSLAAAWMVGPRRGRFESPDERWGLSSPVTALTGTFMLWWAWLAFNAGSTMAVSGDHWKTAALVSVNTLNASIGGSLVGLLISYVVTLRGEKKGRRRYWEVGYIITAILGGLVGVTAGCSLYSPAESLLIGAIGALVATLSTPFVEWLKVDDPVSAISIHFFAGIWSTLAVGNRF